VEPQEDIFLAEGGKNLQRIISRKVSRFRIGEILTKISKKILVRYEGWNFNSGNYLFTTDTK